MPEKLADLKSALEKFEEETVKANIPPNRMPADFKASKVWGHWGACKAPLLDYSAARSPFRVIHHSVINLTTRRSPTKSNDVPTIRPIYESS
jgi:hypothetical protein